MSKINRALFKYDLILYGRLTIVWLVFLMIRLLFFCSWNYLEHSFEITGLPAWNNDMLAVGIVAGLLLGIRLFSKKRDLQFLMIRPLSRRELYVTRLLGASLVMALLMILSAVISLVLALAYGVPLGINMLWITLLDILWVEASLAGGIWLGLLHRENRKIWPLYAVIGILAGLGTSILRPLMQFCPLCSLAIVIVIVWFCFYSAGHYLERLEF